MALTEKFSADARIRAPTPLRVHRKIFPSWLEIFYFFTLTFETYNV